jgi:hypothetical protein
MTRVLSGAAALALSCSVLVAAHAAGDAPPSIAIGEVAGTPSGGARTREVLANVLANQLASRDDVRLANDHRRARYVLRGSLVQLDQREVADGIEVRCEVSLVVSDARGGAIRALLTGRAGARGIDDPNRLAHAAIEAAVRGALRPLGAQIR